MLISPHGYIVLYYNDDKNNFEMKKIVKKKLIIDFYININEMKNIKLITKYFT
jgi:hypothetical protein